MKIQYLSNNFILTVIKSMNCFFLNLFFLLLCYCTSITVEYISSPKIELKEIFTKRSYRRAVMNLLQF